MASLSLVEDCLKRINSQFKIYETSIHTGPESRSRKLPFKPSEVCKTLENLLQRARSLENSLNLIMRLPSEVLHTIFEMVQEPEDPYSCQLDRGWMVVLHICRVWRSTALGHRRLWAAFSVDMHDRSGDASRKDFGKIGFISWLENAGGCRLRLELYSNSYPYGLSEDGELAFTALPRVQHLSLCGRLGSEVREELATASCPMLRSLSVSAVFSQPRSGDMEILAWAMTPPSSQESAMQPVRFRVLPTLFGGKHSGLRSLSLHRLLKYSGNTFGHLRQLRFSSQRYLEDSAISALVNLLEANPRLEDLMFSAVEVRVGELIPADRRVSLPSLHRLAFQSVDLEESGYIMSWLQSESEELALSCTSHNHESLSYVLDQCALGFPALSEFHSVKMELRKDYYTFSAMNWSSGLHLQKPHIESREIFIPSIDANGFPFTLAEKFNIKEDFKAIAKLMPSVTHLWLHCQTCQDPDDIFICGKLEDRRLNDLGLMLNNASKLRKLVLEFDDSDTYSRILTTLYEHPRTDLPELCVLGLQAFTEMPFYAEVCDREPKFRPTVRVYGAGRRVEGYREWLAHVKKLKNVETTSDRDYPHLDLPRVCTEDTKGIWQWPIYGGRLWGNDNRK